MADRRLKNLMDKSKKVLFSAIFLAAVCAVGVAVSFVLPKNVTEETVELDQNIVQSQTGADDVVSVSPETEEEGPRIGPAEEPIQILANDKNRLLTAEEKAKYPQRTNIPTLYIDLDNGMKLNRIEHSVFTGATYTLVDGDYGLVEQDMSIAGRGNYSWSMEKKTYALSFTEKADVLGMGAAKRWVLISSFNDRTLMRNYMTLSLSYQMGMEGAPECRHVDLYFNGKYHGNYLITEKVQIHDQRVNIDPEIGGLFEIERTYRHEGSGHTWCIECPSGVHVMYKSPTEDEIGLAKRTEQFKKFKNIFIKADIAISKGYEYYSRYIDVDSFIDWYIVNEFVKNYDSGFTTSCYCWVDNNGIIHMGPVWDYDTCMANQMATPTIGHPEGYHVAQPNTSYSAAWYVTLTQDEDFVRLLSERWTELVDNGVLEWFFNEWYIHGDYMAASIEDNMERWPQTLTYYDRSELRTKTHEDEVRYVDGFMSARYNWFCEMWYLGDDPPLRETDWYKWDKAGKYLKD